LRYGDDYKKAGFPSITSTLNYGQISRLTFVWITSTAIAAVLLPFFGIIKSAVISYIIIGISFILIISFLKWPGIKTAVYVNRAFLVMNIYFLIIMILIITDSVFF
ncbi:MAG: hypothetical protein ABR597_07105, partial [Bacteroidales bacterium]